MSRMRHHEPAMEDDTMEQPDDARGAAWLVERFAEFNRLYFGGRLPYRIIISTAVLGDCDRRLRRIRIAEQPPMVMIGTLVHEMVHAAVGDHGRRFQAEIARVHGLGAPVSPVDLSKGIRPTAVTIRNGVDDAQLDGATLRQAQRFVAQSYGLTLRKLLRRFPRAAKGTDLPELLRTTEPPSRARTAK